MQVRLFVERDQNECIVNLAGTAYRFKRNEYGHLVSDITDEEHIAWVSNPMHNASFRVYSPPEPKAAPDVAAEAVAETVSVKAGENPRESEAAEPKQGPEATGFPCPICGKRFTSMTRLRGHKGGAHKGA